MSQTRRQTGYIFTDSTLCDGRSLPPIDEWQVHSGPEDSAAWSSLVRDPYEARKAAFGPLLHRVEVEDIPHRNDPRRGVRRRRIVASIDTTPLLDEFARFCAHTVMFMWDPPYAIRLYLETGDEAMREKAEELAVHVWRDIDKPRVSARHAVAATLDATRNKDRDPTYIEAETSAHLAYSWWAYENATGVHKEFAHAKGQRQGTQVTTKKFIEMVNVAFAKAAFEDLREQE